MLAAVRTAVGESSRDDLAAGDVHDGPQFLRSRARRKRRGPAAHIHQSTRAICAVAIAPVSIDTDQSQRFFTISVTPPREIAIWKRVVARPISLPRRAAAVALAAASSRLASSFLASTVMSFCSLP